MRALLITTDGIQEIEIDKSLDAMYRAIGCEVITAAGRPAPGHVAWVDDNGALTVKEGTQAASVPWHGDILFGRILVTALDEEGDTAPATISVDRLRSDLYVGTLQEVNGTLTPVVKPMTTLEENAEHHPEESDERDGDTLDIDHVRWDDSEATARTKINAAIAYLVADPRMKAPQATATLVAGVVFDLGSREQAALAHRMLMKRALPIMAEIAGENGLAVADLADWKIDMNDEDDEAALTMRVTLVPADRHDNYVKHHVDKAIKHRDMKRRAMLLMGAVGDNDEAH